MAIRNNVNIKEGLVTCIERLIKCMLSRENMNRFMQRSNDQELIRIDAGVPIHLLLSLARSIRVNNFFNPELIHASQVIIQIIKRHITS